MEPMVIFGIALIVLIIFLFLGVPVPFAIGLAAVALVIPTMGFTQAFNLVSIYGKSALFDYVLVSLPLFIFMAEMVGLSGIGADLFQCTKKWLSRLPGGLSVAAIWACAMFGAVCGSGAATAAVIGRISIPPMLDNGYSKKLAFGSVTGAATLGQMIPPSLILIIYGVLADESVGKLFIAGIVPGVLLASVLSFYVIGAVTRNHELAPATAEKVTWRERWASTGKIWPVLMLLLLVMGTIYTGVATLTESAAVGAVGSILVVAASRKLSRNVISQAGLNTIRMTCFIMLTILAGKLFGHLLANAGFSASVSSFAQSLASPWLLMLMINVLWIFLGCFLDMASITVLTIPVLLPAMLVMGWDTVWIGIVLLFNMAIGAITPPVGVHFYVTKSVGDGIVDRYGPTSLEFIIRSCIPYIYLTAITMVLIIVFPQLSTWLPAQMFKPPQF